MKEVFLTIWRCFLFATTITTKTTQWQK